MPASSPQVPPGSTPAWNMPNILDGSFSFLKGYSDKHTEVPAMDAPALGNNILDMVPTKQDITFKDTKYKTNY